MGSIGNPKTWVPYMNTKDCSQGFCSLYCPQWCYISFPPPPPIEFPDDDSGPNFSPLVIAIIGILASAFLLVSYYTIISKYCGNVESSRRRDNHDESGQVMEDNQGPSVHEPWQISTTGLDEALIKSITVFKYKKNDGLIEGTDCSVCLSEFQEDESLRLLPKCSHAFHVHCIDTWLRSHSNCPLCRANIIFISSSPLPLPLTVAVTEMPPPPPLNEHPSQRAAVDSSEDRVETSSVDQYHVNGLPKTPSRAFSDLGNVRGRDALIEIREVEEEEEEEEGYCHQQMRRSVSMDHSCHRVSVADVLRMNEEGEESPSSSKQSAEGSKVSNRMRVLHCVMKNPVAMKRSFSSGRLFLTRQGRVRDHPAIPL